MKAIICTKYGPPEVLELREVEKPFPKHNEVCVKIHATSVTASDTIVRGFKLPRKSFIGFMMGLVLGFKKPRNPILGMVLAGEIETVGKGVNTFKTGDSVFGFAIRNNLSMQFGAYAQYIGLHKDNAIVKKPDKLSWEEAAALPYGGLMALYYLRKYNVRNGQHVLIYGASGSIGTMAVQLAKYYGAKVTGVCSTSNMDLVRSLGADDVIDYTQTDFIESGQSFDLILDAVGKSKSSSLKEQCKQALTPNGKYISVDEGSPTFNAKNLEHLKTIIKSGEIKAVIDKTFPLEQMVEAHRYVDKGHKRGNVIINIKH